MIRHTRSEQVGVGPFGNPFLARINIDEFSLSRAFVFHIICRAVERKSEKIRKRTLYSGQFRGVFGGGRCLLRRRFRESLEVMNAVTSLDMAWFLYLVSRIKRL